MINGLFISKTKQENIDINDIYYLYYRIAQGQLVDEMCYINISSIQCSFYRDRDSRKFVADDVNYKYLEVAKKISSKKLICLCFCSFGNELYSGST